MAGRGVTGKLTCYKGREVLCRLGNSQFPRVGMQQQTPRRSLCLSYNGVVCVLCLFLLLACIMTMGVVWRPEEVPEGHLVHQILLGQDLGN